MLSLHLSAFLAFARRVIKYIRLFFDAFYYVPMPLFSSAERNSERVNDIAFQYPKIANFLNLCAKSGLC